MKNFVKICELATILSLFLVSCSNSLQPTQNSLATPILDFSPQANTPFAKTPTVTPIPTSTLHPALDVEGANELVFQLLDDNSNCRLPCWWGITPTITTSQDAKSFLNSFSLIASTNSTDNDNGYMILDLPNGDGLLSPYIEYSSIDGIVNTLIIGLAQRAQNENGGYDQIFDDPAFKEAAQSFMLAELLKAYGQPQEVLVSTYSLQPLGWPVFFDIELFYPEHGFLIVYKTLMEFSANGYIKGCPSKSNINIGLWEAGKYLSIDNLPTDIRDNISNFPLSSYLQIDKATKMSIQDFYETFKEDDGTLCLETPGNLWPMPGQ